MQPVPRPERPVGKDFTTLNTVLWTRRGGGCSYASSSPRVASIVLRNVTGMEMQEYIDQKIANPICGGALGPCNASW
jgi:CubicO group peptidase (beta-lactamase class C family)